MFYPKRIRSIGNGDQVLEIGPGASPHPRANVLLDRRFSEKEAYWQRGGTQRLVTDKTTVLYDGGVFPFEDGQFDYVICSHVLEHVDDVEAFCSEVFRVAKRGYFEFPTILYEYLYNFPVHQQLLLFESGELRHLSKRESGLVPLASVQAVFYRSLELGYAGVIDDLFPLMFQGFEWHHPFDVRKANSISELVPDAGLIQQSRGPVHWLRRVVRWVAGHGK